MLNPVSGCLELGWSCCRCKTWNQHKAIPLDGIYSKNCEKATSSQQKWPNKGHLMFLSTGLPSAKTILPVPFCSLDPETINSRYTYGTIPTFTGRFVPMYFLFTWILIGNRPFFGHLQTPQCPSCYRVQCWFQMTAWHTTGHPSWHPSQTTTETLASDPEALSCPDVLDLIGFRGRKPLQGTSLGTHGTLPPGTVKGWGSETGYQDSCPLQKIWLYGKLGHQQWGTNWESVYGHPLLKGILPLHRKTRTRMVTRPWWGRGGRQNARKSLQGCGAPQEYARELKIACHHLQWGRFSVAFRCEGNELFPFSPILGFFGPSLLGPSASRHAPCIVA